MNFRTLNCEGCKHGADPLCVFARDQLRLAEQRVHWHARGLQVREPEMDVTCDCKSRDCYRRGKH